MPGFVLQHPREQSGALDGHRTAVGVESADPGPLRAAGGKRLAGDRQATFLVGARVGHGLGYLGGFQDWIDHDTAAAVGEAAVLGAVVDKESQTVSDLVGG